MKVAIYCRVSTEDQAERQTIENQIVFAEKYVDLHEMDVFTYYREDGITGTIPLYERPEGTRLLQDAKEKKFDTLLIYKLDRLGRSARIILNSIHELEALGIQIKSMTEPFDTSSSAGRFMITMLAGVADLERETILERMWHGANRAARDGKWLGGIVPYGYFVNENKELEINNNLLEGFSMSEPEVIKIIFNKIGNEKWSTIKVCDYLNALGVPTSYAKANRKINSKDGKRKVATANIWRPGQVLRIAKNTTYKGIHIYGKRSKKERELIERAVPAIVDTKLWEKVQKQLKDNQVESFKNKSRDFLLSSITKCNDCGLTYIGSNNRQTDKAFYICIGKQNYKNPKDNKKCESKNIPADYAENLVWEGCLNYINNPDIALEEIDKSIRASKESSINTESEIIMLTSSLYSKESEKESILDLYRRKIIDSKDVENQLLNIQQEKNRIEDKINELKNKKEIINDLIASSNSASDFLNSLREKSINPDFKTKREIVKSLIKKITVITHHDTNRKIAELKIEYNFTGNNSDEEIKGVIHTDIRAVITPYNGHEIITTNNNIYIIRKKLNLGVKDFAKLCNLSEGAITKAEIKRSPRIDTIKKVAYATNETISFVGGFDGLPENTFAEKLYKAIKYHGHSYEECAKELRVGRDSIARYLNGGFPRTKRIQESVEKYISIIM